jgi:hypothetical protein
VGHIFYNNLTRVREGGTFHTIIEPECESGPDLIQSSRQNAREEHVIYDNRARVREWDILYVSNVFFDVQLLFNDFIGLVFIYFIDVS